MQCHIYRSFSFRPHLPPRSTLFPYTTLFRSVSGRVRDDFVRHSAAARLKNQSGITGKDIQALVAPQAETDRNGAASFGDRKSTRLNSSHLGISYAVFCLKQKKTNRSSIRLRW